MGSFVSIALTRCNPMDNVALIRAFVAENPCSQAAVYHILKQDCETEFAEALPWFVPGGEAKGGMALKFRRYGL